MASDFFKDIMEEIAEIKTMLKEIQLGQVHRKCETRLIALFYFLFLMGGLVLVFYANESVQSKYETIDQELGTALTGTLELANND